MKYIVKRNITKRECPWLSKCVRKGAVVFMYNGCTYGCVSRSGVAVTFEENKEPFFELPSSALGKWEEGK